MKLSEMKRILVEHQIQLTRSLGQNFLHDRNQLERIVHAAQLSPSDRVLEIGPGLGPLTELLIRDAGQVLAIEKDQRLLNILQERFAGAENLKVSPLTPAATKIWKLELVHADALKYLKERRDWSGWKLVSNLPYSVGSRIFVELAGMVAAPELIVATLQLEVVHRLMAVAGEDDYGLLSVLVQLRYEPTAHFKIPASCFFPEPEIDSACITLRRPSEPLVPLSAESTFVKIVKQAFSQRRKMMFKLLKQIWPELAVTAAFSNAGLSPTVRAEAVSLQQFAQLTGSLL